mmetsp:Transcript_63960/g.101808  ORF Transcript_63960/g.101808 Transcript_63960/m.101808 type:complete len:136 (-) Transcript_63960:348-755(-)
MMENSEKAATSSRRKHSSMRTRMKQIATKAGITKIKATNTRADTGLVTNSFIAATAVITNGIDSNTNAHRMLPPKMIKKYHAHNSTARGSSVIAAQRDTAKKATDTAKKAAVNDRTKKGSCSVKVRRMVKYEETA